VLEALSAYADYKASPAAAGAGHQATDAAAEGQAAASRALLHKQLDAVMAAAAAALPPALRAAAATAAAGGSSDGSSGLRSVLQGLGGPEARRLQGDQGGSVLLQQRGVEPPCFLAPLLHAADAAVGDAAAAAAGAGSTPAAVGTVLGKGPGLFTGIGPRSGLFSGALGFGGGSTSRQQGVAATAGKDSVLQPLLFEDEVMAEAGPGTVKLGGKDTARQDPAADVVPLLFGTPAPAAAAAAAAAGKTPGVVRGGLFDTPAAGAAMWDKTPGAGAAGFGMMSEADFERQVRFGTPQPQAAEAGAAGAGVFLYTGQRSHKRMRKTPM